MSHRVVRLAGLLTLVSSLGLAGTARAEEPIRVGSKRFTESVVLGEIIAGAIRAGGGQAVHRRELGGTQVLWQALLRGDIDVYADYTGTIEEEVLEQRAHGLPAIRAALRAQGVVVGEPLGFEDGYALGMREETAARLGLRTLSDLRAHPGLRVGLSDEFLHRPDGWPGLRARYGLPQRDVRGLDHDLAYRGMDAGALDLIDLYTTDPEIRRRRLRVLVDDLRHFPSYQAVLLQRADLAERSPAASRALVALAGRISTDTMIRLNARVELDGVAESRAAAELLDTTAPPLPSRLHRLGARAKEHLGLTLVSLAMAIAIGLPLGIISARRQGLGRFLLAACGVVQTIPSLALLVLMIPLLGIGAAPAIAALFLYGLLPIVRNTHAGLLGISPSLRESADVLGLPARVRLYRVELPLASPSVLAGVRTSAVIGVGTATLGALVGAGGFGQPILSGIRLSDVTLILEGALPAAGLALLVEALFALVERGLVPLGLRLGAGAPPP